MLVLPDGCIELILHAGTPYHSWQGASPQPKAFLAGQISQAILLSPMDSTGVFAVRFQPHGLSRFTKMPAHELTDREVALEHLWPQAHAFAELALAAKSFQRRCELANQFFLDLLTKWSGEADPIIDWYINLPDLAHQRIEVLARQVGLSRRQLERRFKQKVGLSPKRYARIQRLQQTAQRLETRGVNRLTDLAYELGFADQAHMIRDFKQLTGVTPSQYLNKQVPLYFDQP